MVILLEAGLWLLNIAAAGLVIQEAKETGKSPGVQLAVFVAGLYVGHLLIKDLRR